MRILRRTHADVAAAVVYHNSRICRNDFWRDVQVEVKTISPLVNAARQILSAVINRDHDAQKTEQPQHKDNFASANLCCTRIARAARRHPFIQFNSAPKNQYEWPPMPDHFANTDTPVVVKEQQQSNEKQEQARKK